MTWQRDAYHPWAAADLDGDGLDEAFSDYLLLRVDPRRGMAVEPSPVVVPRDSQAPQLLAADADGDGDLDVVAWQGLRLSVVESRTRPRSPDRDSNGTLDECEREATEFFRGDVDQDGRVSITDAVHVLRYLFLGESSPRCLDAADTDDDGSVQLTDAIVILRQLFTGGGPLPEPRSACRVDPTGDSLGCSVFLPCP